MPEAPMPEKLVEAWLRGPIDGVDPLVSPLLFTFAQSMEDLRGCLDGLSAEQIWSRPFAEHAQDGAAVRKDNPRVSGLFGGADGALCAQSLTPLGFHVRHAGGAAGRLATYLRGESLTEAQLESMRAESQAGANAQELLSELEEALSRVASYVRTIPSASLSNVRHVGRLRLPTTVQGLLVHIAEHTQRHVGQAVTTAKLVRSLG